MAANSAIKLLFEATSLRETELIALVDGNIQEEARSAKNDRTDRRGSVNGAFRIPSGGVIHNNDTIIDVDAANAIILNIDLIDDDTDLLTATYKTVRILGGNMKGQDRYLYAQETSKEMWQRWIINPHCQYKLYFDLIIVVMVMTSSLTVPYRMGFALPPTFEWSVLDGITEIFFCLDLFVSFFTAFEYKDSTLDTSLKNIALRYARSWFLIDFVSAVPFYRITTGETSIGVVVRLLKTLKLGRLFRLFKVFKFARIMKLLELTNRDFIPNEFIAIENSFGLMFKLLSYLGFMTHIIACIFSWISIHDEGSTWVSEAEDVDTTFKRYIAAQYWTFATMATVGEYFISILLLI
jgi:hypothetical protein